MFHDKPSSSLDFPTDAVVEADLSNRPFVIVITFMSSQYKRQDLEMRECLGKKKQCSHVSSQFFWLWYGPHEMVSFSSSTSAIEPRKLRKTNVLLFACVLAFVWWLVVVVRPSDGPYIIIMTAPRLTHYPRWPLDPSQFHHRRHKSCPKMLSIRWSCLIFSQKIWSIHSKLIFDLIRGQIWIF